MKVSNFLSGTAKTVRHQRQHPLLSGAKVRIIVGILLTAFAFQSGLFITTKSSTWDETHYLGIGKYLLKHGRWDVKGATIHAPLSYYLGSIPLLFKKDDDSLWQKTSDPGDGDFLGSADVLRGQAILSSPENAGDRLLQQTRIPFALLGMLLGYLVFRFSRELYGVNAGLTSLFFYAFCPNLLALSSLAVPDLPLALFSFMFVYFLWRCFHGGCAVDTFWAGLALGLALLSKYTALLLLPVALCLLIVQPKDDRRKSLTTAAIIGAGALATLLVGYGFDLTPYLLGLKLQMSNAQTADVFLLGENSTAGWWHYYFVVFALKTPVPVILLFVCAIYYYIRKSGNRMDDILYLGMPVIAYFAFFSIMPKCSGLRYILPVYPFIFVLIGSLALLGKRICTLTCILGVWHLVATISIAPHYLAYFNEIGGGPGNGYRYLVDSNLDWGQDLKELKKYMGRHKIERVSLSYFGSDSPDRYGIAYDWLPSYVLRNHEPDKEPQLNLNQPLAISVTNLHGTPLDNKEQFKWLLQHEPVAKLGYSIFVYDLSKVKQLSRSSLKTKDD